MTQVSVPCGKCHLCCKRTIVLVLPDEGDDPAQYDTEFMGGGLILKHKENGDCIYLGPAGCTIHGKAPFMCKTYDCRQQFLMYSKAHREQLVKEGKLDKEVLRRAAILIHQEGKNANRDRVSTDVRGDRPDVQSEVRPGSHILLGR